MITWSIPACRRSRRRAGPRAGAATSGTGVLSSDWSAAEWTSETPAACQASIVRPEQSTPGPAGSSPYVRDAEVALGRLQRYLARRRCRSGSGGGDPRRLARSWQPPCWQLWSPTLRRRAICATCAACSAASASCCLILRDAAAATAAASCARPFGLRAAATSAASLPFTRERVAVAAFVSAAASDLRAVGCREPRHAACVRSESSTCSVLEKALLRRPHRRRGQLRCSRGHRLCRRSGERSVGRAREHRGELDRRLVVHVGVQGGGLEL